MPAVEADPVVASSNHSEKRIDNRQSGLLIVLRPHPIDLRVLGPALRASGSKQFGPLALCHTATLNARTERCGRPNASELATDAARPHSL
jgi:hypothetical protein